MDSETHKELQELEDPLVSQDVESVPADRIDDWKAMDLILYQRVHGFEYTKRQKHTRITQLVCRLTAGTSFPEGTCPKVRGVSDSGDVLHVSFFFFYFLFPLLGS